ncbi:MAG: glycogen/starch synthase, partial [archaeon]|nr:glycogen/starch synthase [archaeon]
MRIALFSWESLHSIAVGGVASHVTELAAALQRAGNEVHV